MEDGGTLSPGPGCLSDAIASIMRTVTGAFALLRDVWRSTLAPYLVRYAIYLRAMADKSFPELLQYMLPPISSEGRATMTEIAHNFRRGILSLLLPTFLLYFALYALVKRREKVFGFLVFLAVAGFVGSSLITVLPCSAMRSLQLFCGEVYLHPLFDLRHEAN